MAIEGELDITTEQLVKDSAMMEKSPDSMITVVSCVVHSRKHRSLFQHLINNLRNAKIVPKTFMNKIPRLICTCKKEHFHEYFDDLLTCTKNMPAIKETLLGRLNAAQLNKLKETLLKLLETEPSPSMRHDQIQLGCDKLILMLNKALDNDHQILSYINHPESSTESTDQKYKFEKVITVKLMSHYLRFVFGSGHQHTKAFQKQHNCILHQLPRGECDNGLDTDQLFSLRTVSAQAGDTIEQEFRQVVDRVVKTRMKHDEMVVRFQEKRRKYYVANLRARKMRSAMGSSCVTDMTADSKDKATDDYSTKYRHMLRDRHLRRLEKEHPALSVLEESESCCVNCRLPYNKNIENTNGACKYHPGYLITYAYFCYGTRTTITGFRWTCCQIPKSSKSAECQKNSHQNDGCAVGRHLWKPHKRTQVAKKHDELSEAKHKWTGMKHAAKCNRARNMTKIWLNSDQ